MKVLMVCLGNICRSPLAQGILQQKADKAGLDWRVDSAGTDAYMPGIEPHGFSQKVALQHGIDLSTQHCRQFRKEDMAGFDRIYVMDTDNYENVKRLSGEAWDASKVCLLLDELYSGTKRNIPDPWRGTEKDFQDVYKMIDDACTRIIGSAKKI